MCHHWFMHIETHPRLGKSHTRASTIVIMVIIHNTFHVHMALQLFLTKVYLWQGIAIGLDVTCPTRILNKQQSIPNNNHSRIHFNMLNYPKSGVTNCQLSPRNARTECGPCTEGTWYVEFPARVAIEYLRREQSNHHRLTDI